MRNAKLAVLAFGGIMAIFGCTKQKANTAVPAEQTDIGFDYSGFDLSKTLLSKGNNRRIKKAIQKIKNGKKVYVACIGGSITEGECGRNKSYTEGYAYKFAELLQETFAPGKTNVHSVVAGISGTPSPLGLIRYKRDVLQKLGRAPDILVIEFAVNDWQECTNTGAFEQLIRGAMEANKDAAVIALYSIASYGSQKWAMSPIAQYYQIQEVDMEKAKSLENYWTSDKIHPSVFGHSVMAQSLMFMLKKIDGDEQDAKTTIPAEYKNSGAGMVCFKGFQPLLFGDEERNKDISAWSAGSFTKIDTATQTLKSGDAAFPKNWSHKSGNEPLSFSIKAKNLIVAYRNSGGGKAEVFVDGKKVQFKTNGKPESFLNGGASGWNGISTSLIFSEENAALHNVEIKMQAGYEDKTFTICGFGYSK